MDLQLTILEQSPQGTRCRVDLPRTRRNGPTEELALVFTVTPEGALAVDNRQSCARLCTGRRSSLLLAEAMLQAARAQVPEALSGRSLKGLARELRLHRRAYALGLLRRHSGTTEAGSVDPAAPDYDDNALWFERPVRGLPAVLKALLARRARSDTKTRL